MTSDSNKYVATTVPLITVMVLAVLGGLFLDGAWKIIPIVVLLLAVFALSGTIGAQVRKMRDAQH